MWYTAIPAWISEKLTISRAHKQVSGLQKKKCLSFALICQVCRVSSTGESFYKAKKTIGLVGAMEAPLEYRQLGECQGLALQLRKSALAAATLLLFSVEYGNGRNVSFPYIIYWIFPFTILCSFLFSKKWVFYKLSQMIYSNPFQMSFEKGSEEE